VSSGEQALCVVVYPEGGSEGHFVCHVPAQSPGVADAWERACVSNSGRSVVDPAMLSRVNSVGESL